MEMFSQSVTQAGSKSCQMILPGRANRPRTGSISSSVQAALARSQARARSVDGILALAEARSRR